MTSHPQDDRCRFEFRRSEPVNPDDVDQNALLYNSADHALAASKKSRGKKTFALTRGDLQVFVNASSKQAAKNKFLDAIGILCRPVSSDGEMTTIGLSEQCQPTQEAIAALARFLIGVARDKQAQLDANSDD